MKRHEEQVEDEREREREATLEEDTEYEDDEYSDEYEPEPESESEPVWCYRKYGNAALWFRGNEFLPTDNNRIIVMAKISVTVLMDHFKSSQLETKILSESLDYLRDRPFDFWSCPSCSQNFCQFLPLNMHFHNTHLQMDNPLHQLKDEHNLFAIFCKLSEKWEPIDIQAAVATRETFLKNETWPSSDDPERSKLLEELRLKLLDLSCRSYLEKYHLPKVITYCGKELEKSFPPDFVERVLLQTHLCFRLLGTSQLEKILLFLGESAEAYDKVKSDLLRTYGTLDTENWGEDGVIVLVKDGYLTISLEENALQRKITPEAYTELLDNKDPFQCNLRASQLWIYSHQQLESLVEMETRRKHLAQGLLLRIHSCSYCVYDLLTRSHCQNEGDDFTLTDKDKGMLHFLAEREVLERKANFVSWGSYQPYLLLLLKSYLQAQGPDNDTPSEQAQCGDSTSKTGSGST